MLNIFSNPVSVGLLKGGEFPEFSIRYLANFVMSFRASVVVCEVLWCTPNSRSIFFVTSINKSPLREISSACFDVMLEPPAFMACFKILGGMHCRGRLITYVISGPTVM